MLVGIVDYGVGNLRSIMNSLEAVEAGAVMVERPEQVDSADRIILPGVGAFSAGMAALTGSGMIPPLHRFVAAGKPLLGICLGMQLACRLSYENGEHRGLGWVDAVVEPFPPQPGLKTPHMGWNSLTFTRDHPIRTGVSDGEDVYFVHSYRVRCADPGDVLAVSDHGGPFTAFLQKGNVFGMQFHPEKSQRAGLRLLKNFVGW